MKRSVRLALAAAALAISAAAVASETANYTYDALGRLTAVSTTGGPNSGTAVSTNYDPAGNRSSYSVTGATGGAAPLQSPTQGPAALSAGGAGNIADRPTAPADAGAGSEPEAEAPPALETPETGSPERDR